MVRLTIVVVCTTAILISYLMNGCDARRIQVDDLDVAASGKQEEWKKGEESGYHQSDHGKHGKKGEKGYEEEHG